METDGRRDQIKAQQGSTSGLIGVSWHKHSKSWVAQITIKSRTKYIGKFNDKHAAFAAYLDAKKQSHPESRLAKWQ